MYADTIKNDESLCKKLKISGKDHLFLNYNFKHSKNDNGGLINSVNPQGLSGGSLVDMGTFGDWIGPTNKPAGKLAGMLIEMHKPHKAIIAVKINKIVNFIKQKTPESQLTGYAAQGIRSVSGNDAPQ